MKEIFIHQEIKKNLISIFALVLVIFGLLVATPTFSFAINGAIADPGGPYTFYLGDSLTLDGSNSSPPPYLTTYYNWDLDSDGLYDDEFGATVILDPTEYAPYFPTSGVYGIGLYYQTEQNGSFTHTVSGYGATTVTALAPIPGPIPEPATMLLLGSGLLGLWGFRKKFKK